MSPGLDEEGRRGVPAVRGRRDPDRGEPRRPAVLARGRAGPVERATPRRRAADVMVGHADGRPRPAPDHGRVRAQPSRAVRDQLPDHANPGPKVMIPRAYLLARAAVAALAGCAADTSVQTTPTFSAARYLPPDRPAAQAPVAGPTPEPHPENVRGLTGVKAISAANREATVEPDDASMRGATWYIEDVQPTLIYRVCTATRRVTTILLPPGERFNGAVGGDVDAFLINVAYAGPRPAVSILPRTPGARGNLQLVTTRGFYSSSRGGGETALTLAAAARKAPPVRPAASMPQPEGDSTRLALVREDGPLPAWAPAEVWADSVK